MVDWKEIYKMKIKRNAGYTTTVENKPIKLVLDLPTLDKAKKKIDQLLFKDLKMVQQMP